MAVVGVARLERTVVCEPSAAWRRHSRRLGLDRDEFDAYLGDNMACLLILGRVESLRFPLRLRDLRRRGAFRPPQSYRFVSPSDPIQIRGLLS